MQRAQQQQQQKQQQQQPQQPPPPQQQPQQKDISSITEKREPTSKQSSVAQASDVNTSNPSNQQNVKTTDPSTNSVSTSIGRESTSIAGTINTSVGHVGDASTAPTTTSTPNLQLAAPRAVSSHSPHIPLTSSSSTLFMPTPGVIASIGRASPNVGTAQPGQIYFHSSLPESLKHGTPHSSRLSHPETIFSGLVYPKAVDPSHPSRLGNPLIESHPLYQASSAHKPLPHSTSLHPSLSTNTMSTKAVRHSGSPHAVTSYPGSFNIMTSHPVSQTIASHHPGSHSVTSHPVSYSMTSHQGISHAGKPHSSHPSEPGHAPASSIVLTLSGSPSSAANQSSRPASHSPVIVAQQDKPHSQVTFLKETSTEHHSSHKPLYLPTFPGSIRGEPAGRGVKTDDGRRGTLYNLSVLFVAYFLDSFLSLPLKKIP